MSAPTDFELSPEIAEWSGCGHKTVQAVICTAPGCESTFCSSDCANLVNCDYCEAIICREHVREHPMHYGNRPHWEICPTCEAEENAEFADESARLLAAVLDLRQLARKIEFGELDADSAYEALQELSLRILA